jgi:hypothetical protein
MPENERGLQRRPLGIVRCQMGESTWSQLSMPSASITSCVDEQSSLLNVLAPLLLKVPALDLGLELPYPCCFCCCCTSSSSSSGEVVTRGPLIAHIPIVIDHNPLPTRTSPNLPQHHAEILPKQFSKLPLSPPRPSLLTNPITKICRPNNSSASNPPSPLDQQAPANTQSRVAQIGSRGDSGRNAIYLQGFGC